jgi:hypothetical protein
MQTRRDFIQSTALGAGAFTLGASGAFAKSRAGQPPIRFIFMTKSNGLRPHELALPGFSGAQKQADTKKDALNVDLSGQQLPEWMSVLDAHKKDMAIIQGLSAKGIACGHAGNQACLGMFKTGERRVLGNVKWATVDVELGRLYPSPFQHVEVQTAGGNRGIVAGQAATGKLAYNYAYADPRTAYRELFKSVSNDKATRAGIDADSLVLDYLSSLSATNYNNVEGLERLKMTRISQTIGDIKDRDRQINAISDQILKNIPDVNEADLAGDLTTVEKQEAFAKVLVSAMRAGLTNSALFTLDTLGTPYTGIPQLEEGSILNLHNLGHKKGYAGRSADEVRAYIRMHHMRLMADMVAAFKSTPEGNGTMFDNTVITYQAENGETHHSNGIEQPIIMLAGKNARMNCLGNYVRLPGYGQQGHKTLGNWYTTHLNNHGNPIEHYGQFDPELNQFGIDQEGPIREFLA